MQFLKGLVLFVTALGILAVGALAAGWVWLESEITGPGPYPSESEFKVERGEGLSSVSRRLKAQGLIEYPRMLDIYARLHAIDTGVKAGTYIIPARASAADILQQLVEGRVKMLSLTVPEGLTTAQIVRLVRDAAQLTGPLPEKDIGEGVLLPDTYLFEAGTTRVEFLARMEAAQDALLGELWPDRQNGLPIDTPTEAIILASIVEKETGIAAERPLIAGLFTERLKRGMRLESDPTIIYGISGGEPLYNRYGQRRTLYRSEIDRTTAWNTYQIDGLPPTPICNPGRDAIAAVLNPPATNYVFFVADGKGGHLFAETYAEHQRNVAAYRAYERAEIARERGEAP